MCPPGLNDVATAESLAIETRLKAMLHETSGVVVTEPTLEDLHRGGKMAPAPESTPHPTAVQCSSQIQGAVFLHEMIHWRLC